MSGGKIHVCEAQTGEVMGYKSKTGGGKAGARDAQARERRHRSAEAAASLGSLLSPGPCSTSSLNRQHEAKLLGEEGEHQIMDMPPPAITMANQRFLPVSAGRGGALPVVQTKIPPSNECLESLFFAK